MKNNVLFLIFVVLILSVHVNAESEYSFRFVRNKIFRNSYFLHIKNMSNKTLMFGGYGTDYYYAEMNNGSRISLDTKAFNEHYFKGAMWISKDQKAYLPFKIKKKIINNAKNLVFIGEVAVKERSGSFVNYKDRNEFIITTDLINNTTTYKVGKKLDDQPNVDTIFNNDGENTNIKLNDLDHDSGDDYRLKIDDRITGPDDGFKFGY